jgi:hypothetical protein
MHILRTDSLPNANFLFLTVWRGETAAVGIRHPTYLKSQPEPAILSANGLEPRPTSSAGNRACRKLFIRILQNHSPPRWEVGYTGGATIALRLSS